MLLPVSFLYSAHFGLKMVLTGKIHVTITAPVRHRYRAVRWSSDPDCRLSVLLKVMKDWWLYSSALNLSQYYLEKPLWFLRTGYTDVAQQTFNLLQRKAKSIIIYQNVQEPIGWRHTEDQTRQRTQRCDMSDGSSRTQVLHTGHTLKRHTGEGGEMKQPVELEISCLEIYSPHGEKQNVVKDMKVNVKKIVN